MPAPPSFNPGFYSNFEAKLNRKYDILAEHAAADTLRAKTDAATLPAYREALGFHARSAGQLSLEQAATEAARRYMDPDWLRGAFRQMYETGQLPGYTRTPGAGAPEAPATTAGPTGSTPAPIQFQTLPAQPGYTPPAATPATPAATTADATPSILTSPESVADMTPEQLASWTQGAAQQGTAGASAGTSGAPTGRAAQQRLAAAQQRLGLPSLLRPTPVTTTKASAVSPLYSPGFRRGTPNVRPRGYAEGEEDVLLRPRPLFGPPPGTRGGVGTIGGGAPGGPPNLPPPGGPVPTPAPAPAPPIDPRTGYPSPAEQGRPNPDVGQPAGPGLGTPYDPGAMTGIPNLGGIVDATLRLVNPDKFAAAMEAARPSENVEDRRFGEPPTSALGTAGNVASDIGGRIAAGGQALASDIWKAITGDRAAPGSLAEQAGYNQIPGQGPTAGSILGGFSLDNLFTNLGSIFGGGATTAPLTETPVYTGTSGGGSSGVLGGGVGGDMGSEEYGYKKGTANVKAKGGKSGKSDKGGPPKGLEALLPILAAMQAGGGGPPVAPPAGPPAAPAMKKGSADVKKLKKGSANVKGKSKGGKGGKSDDMPAGGLEDLLAALSARSGAVGPQAAEALPPAMGSGAAAPPGMARGTRNVQPMPNPGYPFGAGYLFGANEVPGEGTGKVDTVPAMLAPHEAVLNKAAADILGRGLIAALNAQGVKQMGMRRGATASS